MNEPQPSDVMEVVEDAQDSVVFEPLVEPEAVSRNAFDTSEESEASYRYLFEANPHPMWITDCETMRFLLVNEAAIDHYGYSQEEFLSMTIKDIRPAANVHLLVKPTQECQPKNGKRSIWRHRTKDGRSIDVEITAHKLRFRDRAAWLCIVNDVTEQAGRTGIAPYYEGSALSALPIGGGGYRSSTTALENTTG